MQLVRPYLADAKVSLHNSERFPYGENLAHCE